MGCLITPLWMLGLMLLAASGLDLNANLTWHDQHRIEQIALLSVVALGGLTVWRRDLWISIMRQPSWVKVALACGFGGGMLSVIAADYPRLAALEWATLLLLLGLVLLLARQANQANALFNVWAPRLIVALAVVIALKIMAGYMAAMIVMGHLDSVMLFEGTFSNRRFFGQVASMIVPLLAYPLLRGGMSKRAQAAMFVLLAVWWMLVIVSGTRGTWAALALVAAVLATVSWRASKRWIGVQAIAFGVGALLYTLLFVWLPFWLGSDTALENRLSNFSALNGRAELWALALAQIQTHPWLGVGPMHLAAIHNDFGAHPHNAVLQLAAEWGVPATLALILPAVAGLQSLLAALRRQEAVPNVLMVCLTASLMAAGIQSMVDGVVVIPYTQTLLVLVVGWALGECSQDRGVTSAIPASGVMRLGTQGLSLLALIMLLNGVFPEILNRVEVTQAFVDAGHLLVPPRYWTVGWIP